MKMIDADICVTVNLYDDEHEEYRDERMTIAECLDRFTDKGCPTGDEPRKLSNREWKEFLAKQFSISKTSAREMLHGMMRWKKEDNFKRTFNPIKE
jgi:hypothetical protein